MDDAHPLISTIVFSIVFASFFGYLCKSARLPPIVGYLVAGIILGPYTPGFVGDAGVALQLAEIGIILLMFGVGLHFSVKDLWSVRGVAVPGALFQIGCATVLGAAYVMYAFGIGFFQAVGFGLALSVASTVVLLRALEERGMLQTHMGRITVGWLIVEDLVMVLAIVFLPVIAHMLETNNGFDVVGTVLDASIVVLKIALFVALMIIGGRRVLPWLLVRLARTRSEELLSLGTIAIALGFAYVAYSLFGASFALGAFLAGVVLNESEIGAKSAERSLPLRDMFAVLFFVSVGMLFNPEILLEEPVAVLAVLGIIVVGKSLAALAITLLFKQSRQTSLVVAASLAQIGEFSFILVGMAMAYGLLPQTLYDMVIAGAILSIALNPLLFWAATRRLPAT
ncbi:MAG: cation:proton antiporter [Bdellovibrionales bacterium]